MECIEKEKAKPKPTHVGLQRKRIDAVTVRTNKLQMRAANMAVKAHLPACDLLAKNLSSYAPSTRPRQRRMYSTYSSKDFIAKPSGRIWCKCIASATHRQASAQFNLQCQSIHLPTSKNGNWRVRHVYQYLLCRAV